MMIRLSHDDYLAAMRTDCIPMFLDRLASGAGKWLEDMFPPDSELLPVLLARQEMAGHVNFLTPPDLLNSEYRVVRVGETTFDLQGQLVDLSGRTVARSTTVFAVTNRMTTRTSEIPPWLARTLKRKDSHD